ncbi:hypothetical protein EKH55_0824 [Sinorhizobium alkalisoli]|nr:hypothetical protein EKH55_0824 [Sinorhizobium alkalisoli]
MIACVKMCKCCELLKVKISFRSDRVVREATSRPESGI